MIDWSKELYANPGMYKGCVADLVRLCGGLAKQAGWDLDPLDVPRSLMLIVSELGEAMEGHRKWLDDDKLPQYSMLIVELADAVIRIFHMAHRLENDDEQASITFGRVLVDKLLFNTQREDHKLEVRNAEGGKKY